MKKISTSIVIGAIILALVGMFMIAIEKRNSSVSDKFEARQDSLIKITDSLELEIEKDSVMISSLALNTEKLEYKLSHVKAKIVPVIQYVDSSKKEVAQFTDSQLVEFYNKRYLSSNSDTAKVLINHFPLKSGALELVEYDGLKKTDAIKDTIILIKDSILSNKDSVIKLQDTTISKFKSIVLVKDTQINDYKVEYSNVKNENKKLKLLNKISKAVIAVMLVLFIVK
jgi:hypothetical protein